VMELITGPTLGRRLQDGPLPPAQVAQLAADLAETLGYVHAAGVLHRDIKPANILLDTPTGSRTEFSAKLTDFGVARLMDSTRLTMHGMTVGTANYLSPEQAQGAPLTPASDIYSLGLVLLECLTGQVAFPGTGVEAAAARLHRPPSVPDWLGPEWVDLLGAMTAAGPAARPTPREVGMIAAGLDGRPVSTGASQPGGTGPAGATTTVLPESVLGLGAGPDAGLGPGHTRPLTTVSAQPAPPAGPARRGSRRAWRAVVAGAVLAVVVAVVVIVVLLADQGSTTAPLPTYPSVPGPLGAHLEQLEGTLP
jgi:eukaryotic-like serine/threonine-protein kinase